MQTPYRAQNILPYALYALTMLGIVIWMPMLFGDDKIFSEIDLTLPLLYERYFIWSSRTLVDATVIFLCHHFLLFKIISYIMILAVPYLIAKTLNIDSKNMGYVYVICLLYNMLHMGSAGYIATMCNYYFVLFAFLLTVYLLNYRENTLAYALSLPATLYCVSHEQGCLVLLAYLLFLVACGQRDKKILFTLSVTIAFLFVILLSPGNHLRSLQVEFYPEYADFDLFYKAYIGVFSTLFYYTLVPNVITLFLLYSILLNKNTLLKATIKFLIFAVPVYINKALVILTSYMAREKDLSVYYKYSQDVTFQNIFYAVFSVSCFVYIYRQIFVVFQNTKTRLTLLFLLTTGLVSRFILGLSSTVFASAERTYIYSDFFFLAAGMIFFFNTETAWKKTIIGVALALQVTIHYAKLL